MSDWQLRAGQRLRTKCSKREQRSHSTERERGREGERETERETERQRERDRQTDRKGERERGTDKKGDREREYIEVNIKCGERLFLIHLIPCKDKYLLMNCYHLFSLSQWEHKKYLKTFKI